nr:restriction endonuclease subunit S [Citrobacter freundii]
MAKYKAYPEYKDSGVEWLGNVPTKWLITELKRYSWVKGGYAFASDLFISFGEPVIRIGDISQDGSINLANCKYVSRTIAKQSQSYIVQNGELLMAMTGATIGKAGFYENKSPALINQRVGLFKTLDKLMNYRFLWYTLKSSGYQEYIKLTAFGGAQPNISDAGMVGYRTTIPSLQEQVFIASFLDNETAKIDSLIEKQQQIIELLKEKRQAVISHAVTKGLNPDMPMRDSGIEWLGKVPQHWQCTKIKYIAILTPRKSSIRFKYNDKCTFIPMEKLKRNSLFTDENTLINKVINSYTYFEDNDLLLAKVTPCFENKNIAIADGLTNGIGFGSTEIYVLRTTKKIRADYLLYRLQEDNFMRAATSAMTGAGGLKRVPSEFLLNYPIALPPQSEIDKIVESLSKQESHYNLLELNAMQGIQLLKERRTALISAAVTGKIDVRNWRAPDEQTTAEAEAAQ